VPPPLAVPKNPEAPAVLIPEPEPSPPDAFEDLEPMIPPPVSDRKGKGKGKGKSGLSSRLVWAGLAAVLALIAVGVALFRNPIVRLWPKTAALYAAAGVSVSVASDNTRDPFYAYGDLDLLEVYRESVRILQLDHTGPDWLRLVASTPAAVMGLPDHGRLQAGLPADLIVLRARSFNEMNARPQNDRAVLVKGRPIDTTPPDYRELDPWVGSP
jgi:hypothetical protein